jgi:hypothetical protein
MKVRPLTSSNSNVRWVSGATPIPTSNPFGNAKLKGAT